MDLAALQGYPKILGNTDPLNMLKYFSGVQTSSEYDSGIHIQGCDNAHNYMSAGGVPIFGANHLFGLFSIFNPSHYSQMTFTRSVTGSSYVLSPHWFIPYPLFILLALLSHDAINVDAVFIIFTLFSALPLALDFVSNTPIILHTSHEET